MLKRLVQFEWTYHSRQLSFIAAAVVFFAMGFLSVFGRYGGSGVHVNSPFSITVILSLMSLTALFVIMLLCANGVLRDSEFTMQEIVCATAVTKFQFMVSRFAGIFTATATLMVLVVGGMVLGTLISDRESIGPFELSYYLWPFGVLVIPNIFFSTVVLFAVAALTRSLPATYVAGVSMYILYWVGSLLGNSPILANSTPTSAQHEFIAVLLDPYGLAGVFGQARFWSTLQRNSQLISLDGALLVNRFLWFGLALAVLGGVYKLFSFGLHSGRGRKSRTASADAVATVRYSPLTVSVQKASYVWAALQSKVRLEVVSIFKSVPFIVLMMLWVGMTGIEIIETIFSGIFGIASYPTTGVLVDLMRDASAAVMPVIFCSSELIWRERNTGVHALVDSTPATNAVFFVSKCLALALIVATLIGMNILIGLLIQLTHGYFYLQPDVYITLLYYSGLPLFLMGLLAMFVQSMVSNKYLGMFLTGLIIGFFLLSTRLGIEHPLLRFAIPPRLQFSDMNGFGHYADAFHWLMLYWSGFAGFLSALAFGLWRRGVETRLLSRLKSINYQWGFPGRVTAAIGLFAFLTSGIFIFYQTNVVKHYRPSNARLDWQADYEKKYKSYSAMPQPTIVGVRTQVDLYPDERRYHVSGHYRLTNKTATPLERILIGRSSEVNVLDANIPGASIVEREDEFGHVLIQLGSPLPGGESIDMTFSMDVSRSGFDRFNNEHSILSNGTYIELEKYLPFFGYADDRELDDIDERRKRSLPEREIPNTDPDKPHDYEWVEYETIVSTSRDQTVVTVGELQKEWHENGRRYFQYTSDEPVPFEFAIASARFDSTVEMFNGVSIQFYYHPRHEYNVRTMMESVKHSLDSYSRRFGPYPFNHIRLAEIPQYRGAATAYPGIIFIAEPWYLFDFRDLAKPNYAYTISHEVAHQWWGTQLEPAYLPGYKMLTETLAQYSEDLVLEEKYGRLGLIPFLETDLDVYLASRGYDDEPESPLYQTDDQTFVHYQRGAIVMSGLKSLLTEDTLNAALRRLFKTHAYPKTKAVTRDFLNELYESSSLAQQTLIDDWFKKVFIYDLSIDSASFAVLDSGRYDVTMHITAIKNEVTGLDAEKAARMREDIEVGIFEAGKDSLAYFGKHEIHDGHNILRVVMDRQPGVAVVDPFVTRVDQNRPNNSKECEIR